MKILYFSPHPNLYLGIPSGPGVHMREVIQGFEQLGHEVEPVIMGGVEEPLTTVVSEEAGSPSLKHRLKPFIPNLLWQTLKDLQLMRFDKHAADELEEAIRRFQPDLIYERCYYGMTSGVEVARKQGIRHILEMNAPYPEERVDMEGKSLLLGKAKKKEQQQIQQTSRLVVVSSALKAYAEKISKGAAVKTVITPNAIRSGFEPPSPESIQAKRAALGIAENSTVVGFVGSIFPYHGVDRLIQSFSDLAKKRETHLLIVGDGAVLEDLKRMSVELGLEGKVTFTGKVPHDQVFEHIGVMDITVMATSNWYGSPVKIFEYGAMKKAIVAPDVSPVRDVMTDQENGLLVNDSKEELSAAIATLMDDESKRESIANSFYSKVFSKHTWKKMCELILSE